MTTKKTSELKRLEKLRAAWRKSIPAFSKEAFGIDPTTQQLPIMDEFSKPGAHVAIKAGHGVGKTALMAICGLWHTLLFPDNKGAATAPSATQLKDVLMAECGKLINQAHPWVKSQLDPASMRISVKGMESTQFLTARTARPESPDALQGLHATNMAYFIDEAFGVADSIFEVARGGMSTKGARALMCGNPTATSGYAFEAFHRNKHLWKTYTLSCIDSPLVDPSYISEMKQEYGEDSDVYRVRVLGEFPRASICQLVPRELADKAAAVTLGRHQYEFAPIVLGVDVAWEGDDRSCIYLRQGLFSKCLGVWSNIDNMRLGGLVNQFWSEHKADAVFIDVGWGSGVIDFLRGMGRSPIPVNFGGSSLSLEYANKRTEMWLETRKWLEGGGMIERNDDLIEDLISPEYYFLPNGKKILEQKKLMKKRGLRSPDLGDALALTFAFPVQKMPDQPQYSGNRQMNYGAPAADPFD